MGEHGAIPGQTTKVPDDTGTFSLGAWISVQRQLHRRGLLAEERGAALEAVEGWRWDPREDGWWEKFDALRDYMLTNGRDPGRPSRPDWWRRDVNSAAPRYSETRSAKIGAWADAKTAG